MFKIERKKAAAVVLFALSFALLYRHVFMKLVHDWWNDDNYSHGFFVLPLAVYFAWERRRALLDAPRRPSIAGSPALRS